MPFPADLDPADRRDRWKLAFTVFVAKLIVDADGIVDFGELKLLSQAFPDDLLQRVGFLDLDGGYTPAYREAYTEAMRELPNHLELDDKLELITIFHRTCMADGALIQAELLVLREAAEVLGIPLPVLSTHLAGLRSISTSKG
jgi:uncharacterized tellurite resistance protein B-like protein